MTQQEFYSLTGISAEADKDERVFNVANEAYMQSSIEKQKFCELWKTKDGMMEIMLDLADMARIRMTEYSAVAAGRKDDGMFLMQFLSDHGIRNDEANRHVMGMLGERAYIKTKLEGFYDQLTEEDAKLVMEHLQY